jgi:signal transduction histidine kinase/FixJ family two-component response regulator
MSKLLRVLMVEDSESDALLIIEELRINGYDPTWERVDTAAAMTAALDGTPWDIVIADYTMPHFSALDALDLLKNKKLDLPFIIVSGTIGEETAVAALKAGAHDYIVKDNLARLAPAVEREMGDAEVRQLRKQAEAALIYRNNLEGLVTTISTHFIDLTSDEVDNGINYALRLLGEFADVDRSYVFQFSDSGRIMDNTHEWCAEGIEPHIERLKGLSVDAFSWHMSYLRSGQAHHIPRVADLPPEAAAEKEEWELEGIQSLICVPMMSGGEVIGFAGFDSVRSEKVWDDDTIGLLTIVGEIFSHTLERKRAEEALRESEARYRGLSESLEETVEKKVAELKQAESLAAIGRMVSNVAHEVRNPLQNIQIGVDAMREEIAGKEDLEEILEGIDYGVNLLNGIITELLEYSRPFTLQRSSISVGDLVERALKTQAHKLGSINTRLELDRKDERISVDVIKVSAVLVNLISNSVEAMPQGGELTIRSKFHGAGDASVLRLSVSDTGSGIAGEQMKRVGEPFYTTKVTGTGLGLPICKKIIEAHKGSIGIRSKANEGTSVEIMIPLRDSDR